MMKWYAVPNYPQLTINIGQYNQKPLDASDGFRSKYHLLKWITNNLLQNDSHALKYFFIDKIYNGGENGDFTDEYQQQLEKKLDSNLKKLYKKIEKELLSMPNPGFGEPSSLQHHPYTDSEWEDINNPDLDIESDEQYDKSSILKQLGLDDEEIKNYITESRQSIKSDEPSMVITKWIVSVLKHYIPTLIVKNNKREYDKIEINEKQHLNKYVENVKKKIGVNNINISIDFHDLEDIQIFDLAGGEYDPKTKTIFVNLAFNAELHNRVDNILVKMNNFIAQLKEVITHEVTHAIQRQKGPFVNDYSEDKNVYSDVFFDLNNTILVDHEIQAFAKGFVKYYKWQEMFYNELNKLFYNIYSIYIDKIFEVYERKSKDLNTLKNMLELFKSKIVEFQHRLFIYFSNHYRDIEIDESKIKVNYKSISNDIASELRSRGIK